MHISYYNIINHPLWRYADPHRANLRPSFAPVGLLLIHYVWIYSSTYWCNFIWCNFLHVVTKSKVSSHAPSVRLALSPFLGDILSQGVPTKSFHIQCFTANAFAEASEQSVSQKCEPSLRDLLCWNTTVRRFRGNLFLRARVLTRRRSIERVILSRMAFNCRGEVFLNTWPCPSQRFSLLHLCGLSHLTQNMLTGNTYRALLTRITESRATTILTLRSQRAVFSTKTWW